MKKRYSEKYRRIDKICVVVLGGLFFAFAIANLIWVFSHTTQRYSGNEKLEELPKADFSNVIQGKYTNGIAKFFGDRTIFREQIISSYKKMDKLYGFEYKVDGKDLVMLTDQKQNDEKEKDDLRKKTEKLPIDVNETEPTETEPPEITGLALSKSEMKLTAGSGTSIQLLGATGLSAEWSIDMPDVVEIVAAGDDKVDVKAKATGKAVLTCRVEGSEPLTCTFSVEAVKVKENGDIDADFMTNGLIIYGDAVYSSGFYDKDVFTSYADTAAYYKTLFKPEHMTVVIGPTSGVLIDSDSFRGKITDQSAAFREMIGICKEKGVNCPNTCQEILEHRDEYLYYRSDHHWTDLGAYYAYRAFAESVGFEPVPLENFTKKTLTTTYQGSMYQYTLDERVKSFYDTVDAYFPTKSLTMTVHTMQGEVQTYDSAIMEWSPGYPAFLCGDNPYTVINVPENPQDLNVLVLKDSFGNAFVPFLAEHYGNIFVLDTRYSDINIKDTLSGNRITDVVFVNNLEAASSPAWPTLYLKAVGVN